MRSGFRLYLLLTCIGYFLTGILTSAVSAAPGAKQGVIYLTEEQLEHQIIDLKGEWEFYWQAFHTPEDFSDSLLHADYFIPVPDVWNSYEMAGKTLPQHGYATYRLRIVLEDTTSELAVRIKTISTAAVLFVNGKQVYQVGQPGSEVGSSQPDYLPAVIPLPGSYKELDLVFQVSNFHYRKAGLWRPIYLGKEEALWQNREKNLMYEFFLMGGILLMGLYHVVLFVMRRKDASPLFFGLFCLCIVVRIPTTNEYVIRELWPSLGWTTIIRLEYLSFILAVPVFAVFVQQLFEAFFSRMLLKASCLIAFAAAMITLLMPPQIFTYILVFYQVLIVVLSLHGYHVLFLAWRKGHKEALIFLLGFTAMFITVFNDILHANEIIQSADYSSTGLFVFIFAQSFLLAIRFSRSFWEAENLSHRLNVANSSLEKRVQERTQSLQAANGSLLEKNQQIARQNEVLTKLNSELDQFVYSVSHDLRAPVSSALGLIEVARFEQDAEQVKNYLELQEKSLLRLDQFILNILDYSRNARSSVQLSSVALSEIVQQIIETYAYLPNFDRLQWKLAIDESDGFVSDERRLNIILNNLLSNAISYADTRKTQPAITIRMRCRKNSLCLVVQDNGIGIGASHLPHIFDMFYRASACAKGSGLGLFIVRETVEKLGGKIRVFSREKEGTTFIILLPSLKPCTETSPLMS